MRLPRKSDTLTWPNIAPGTTPALLLQSTQPNAAPATEIVTPTSHQTMRLPRKVTLQHDQILRLPRKVTPQQFLRSQATKNFGHKRPKIAVTSDPLPRPASETMLSHLPQISPPKMSTFIEWYFFQAHQTNSKGAPFLVCGSNGLHLRRHICH